MNKPREYMAQAVVTKLTGKNQTVPMRKSEWNDVRVASTNDTMREQRRQVTAWCEIFMSSLSLSFSSLSFRSLFSRAGGE